MDDDKSVSSSSIPIPNWMKSKLNNKYNLDDSAFSPPTDDDGFFFIAYPKHAATTNFDPQSDEKDGKYVSITKALHSNSNMQSNQVAAFAQHTVPCQKYIGGMCDSSSATVKKSLGTDDGFKGEAAQCGKSIVAVAEQMVRTNQLYNGRASDDTFASTGPPSGQYMRTRRNSKSLPSSPLASRKKNPFFTPPLIGADHSEDNLFVDGAITKKLRDLSPGGTGGMRAKPTELREINFWSPTSM